MAFPRTITAGRRSAATTVAWITATSGTDAGNKAVTEGADAVLEIVVVLGVPLSTFGTGDGAGAGEGDVENISLVVTVVTVHAVAKAGGSKRDGGLTNDGEVTVVTVGVTPNTIDLKGYID